nr:hypothetical protein [Actinoplanes sp. N902-109]
MNRRSRTIWGLGVATATAVTAFGVTAWQANAAPGPSAPPSVAAEQPHVSDPSPLPEAATGVGTDPLTSTEVGRARTVALTAQLAAQARDVTRAPGPEYLAVELAEDSGARTANVYYYDYAGNKLVKQVVNLSTGKLTGSYSAAGLQLPAAEREVSTALDLLLASPLKSELTTAYQKATGHAWAGKDGLTVTAHVYKARPADTATKQCGAHRCLQLVVETADGMFIDVNDIIIDLSGRTVAHLA